jgi:hypothetical protein
VLEAELQVLHIEDWTTAISFQLALSHSWPFWVLLWFHLQSVPLFMYDTVPSFDFMPIGTLETRAFYLTQVPAGAGAISDLWVIGEQFLDHGLIMYDV